ncbi:dihydrofolate reductase family protein [Glycomyces sp. NRRL B-16210]|uniref:dihydrofolate reductase family protein n=1 Tax=Glycomyces sp. NRRL B-16210 TaxID=1463821 RepID=UPI0004BF540B|nr:dihydrofolate reductase family protein [Glycomyces sp. NRRL B-16210]
MARLIFSGITSLDGYSADKEGRFDRLEPSQEVLAFLNDREREVGTYLYGRRVYEVMAVWADFGPETEMAAAERDYTAIWQAADKVVYSRTLDSVSTPKTRLESRFDPEAVRRMKAESKRDLGVGGPGLGAAALKAGLVDEVHCYLIPVSFGGGLPFLPQDRSIGLELLEHHVFANGTVFLRYGVTG